MKTLEEALELVVPAWEVGDDRRAAEAQRLADETHAKYSSIAQEVAHSVNFSLLKAGIIYHISTNAVDVNDAVLTLFMLGLQTGIEMEKNDGPGWNRPAQRWWEVWKR